MMCTGRAGITAGELLARRWKEHRPYFAFDENTPGVGLQASWLRRARPGGLEQHWSRFPPTQFRRSCAWASLLPFAQRVL